MATKPITNQRTKQEIREEVAKIDREVPDTEKFVEIMEKEATGTPVEETPVEELPLSEEENVVVEETPIEEAVEEVEKEVVEPEVEVKKELPPVEDRYREAGQEAMILNSKLKKVAETVEEIESLPEPTVDELKVYARELGEDYDNLDTFAQNMLKENLKNKKSVGKITNLFDEEKKVGAWIQKVEDFVDQESVIQSYPELEGMREDFIKYCSKKTHVGADLELLVAGFMWKQPVKRPERTSVLLPSGKGGAGQPKATQPTELTQDDAAIYRQKDPKKYAEMIKKGKFKIDV